MQIQVPVVPAQPAQSAKAISPKQAASYGNSFSGEMTQAMSQSGKDGETSPSSVQAESSSVKSGGQRRPRPDRQAQEEKESVSDATYAVMASAGMTVSVKANGSVGGAEDAAKAAESIAGMEESLLDTVQEIAVAQGEEAEDLTGFASAAGTQEFTELLSAKTILSENSITALSEEEAFPQGDMTSPVMEHEQFANHARNGQAQEAAPSDLMRRSAVGVESADASNPYSSQNETEVSVEQESSTRRTSREIPLSEAENVLVIETADEQVSAIPFDIVPQEEKLPQNPVNILIPDVPVESQAVVEQEAPVITSEQSPQIIPHNESVPAENEPSIEVLLQGGAVPAIVQESEQIQSEKRTESAQPMESAQRTEFDILEGSAPTDGVDARKALPDAGAVGKDVPEATEPDASARTPKNMEPPKEVPQVASFLENVDPADEQVRVETTDETPITQRAEEKEAAETVKPASAEKESPKASSNEATKTPPSVNAAASSDFAREAPVSEKAAPPPAEQIALEATLNRGVGKNQFVMRLDPESLGEVTVRMTLTAQGVVARITVANDEARAAISQQLYQLGESMREKGIDVRTIELARDYTGAGTMLHDGNRGFTGQNSPPPRWKYSRARPRAEEIAAMESYDQSLISQITGEDTQTVTFEA